MEISHKHRKTKLKKMQAEVIWHIKKNTEKFYRKKLTKQSNLITVLNFYEPSRNLKIIQLDIRSG